MSCTCDTHSNPNKWPNYLWQNGQIYLWPTSHFLKCLHPPLGHLKHHSHCHCWRPTVSCCNWMRYVDLYIHIALFAEISSDYAYHNSLVARFAGESSKSESSDESQLLSSSKTSLLECNIKSQQRFISSFYTYKDPSYMYLSLFFSSVSNLTGLAGTVIGELSER